MDRECCICGKKYPERWMMRSFTGRVQWLCWDCYKKGHGEATGFETQAKHKRIKEANK